MQSSEMTFLVGKKLPPGADHIVEAVRSWEEYENFLETIKDDLPKSSRDFFLATWHYDKDDHRCLHDAWLESLVISESPPAQEAERRQIEISIRLLGSYHDGYMTIRYHGVRRYLITTPPKAATPPATDGHGDLLADEVSMSEYGFPVHYMEFSRGSLLEIEYQELEWDWRLKGN